VTLRSLHVRLLLAAAVSISFALILAGFGLVALFGHHVERQLDAQLEAFLAELIGRIEPGDQAAIRLTRDLSDPRFEQPLSGLYWQIQDDQHQVLIRSRSLWDRVLALPLDELALGVVHRHEFAGPNEQSLLVREQQVIVFPDTDPHRLRVAVAIDRSDLLAARTGFTRDMLPYLLILAVVLWLATWWQVKTGLSPLDRVRRGVLAIRGGNTSRLGGAFPDEVQPLVDEINGLLQSRDKAVEDARAWTADLAHGLKTPLTALSADAQRLREKGESVMADNLEHLALAMRQRVDRELIRARLRAESAGRAQHADLVKAMHSLVRTLQRTPFGERLDWQVTMPAQAEVAVQSVDLVELLGNLLENASKWARQNVRVDIRRDDAWIISIDDDGPGVAAEQLSRLGERGLRLDERREGTGLGLAIAQDVVAAYRGSIEFDVSSLGGLRVIVALPAASIPAPEGMQR
jgi:signal transduction histidine kinase